MVQPVQPSARYRAIEEWLSAEGRVDVVDMAFRLGVAQETIRRDLRTMESDGKLERVHGGAVRVEAGPGPLLSAPVASEQDALELSVRVWSQLPRRGTILLGSGSLGLALAQTILASPPEAPGLTIVTNSLDAAVLLSRASRLEVYNIGGTVSRLTRAQEGDWAVVEMERLHVDVSVICPAGVSVDRGLTQATPAAAAVSQVEVASGQRVIALATPAILGVSAFVQFAQLEEIDLLALSGSPDPASLQPFLERGTAVSTAAEPV
ncbi:MAG: DeoR/GlpR transcriptional regulator [Friedmanniella sp.]|nr:DeoR/GlpR transcriptional regulator [Friedmanniella sp.]